MKTKEPIEKTPEEKSFQMGELNENQKIASMLAKKEDSIFFELMDIDCKRVEFLRGQLSLIKEIQKQGYRELPGTYFNRF